MNLVDDKWLGVRMRDGRIEELGIVDALVRAREISELVAEVPTQVFAIMRVLLAFLSRSVGGPPDVEAWWALWEAPAPPIETIGQYAEQHRSRFELLDGEHPFMQVPNLHTSKGEFSPLSKIIADVPDGHPFFTTRSGSGLASMSPAEAARWLIHVHAFDPSGIKSGAVGDTRVKAGKGYPIGTGWAGNLGGLIVEGSDLWETLLLNLVPLETTLLNRADDDPPAWERPQDGASASRITPTGPVSLFTWQSRRVRLLGDEQGVTGVLVANGDRLEPFNKTHLEPMTAWRRSAPQQKKRGLDVVYMPRTHDPSRALWRGLAAILPIKASLKAADGGQDNVTAAVVQWAAQALRDVDRFITVRAIGVEYGSQNSTITEIIDDRLDIPIAVLAEDSEALAGAVLRAVENTDRHAVFAVKNLASNLARAAGADSDALLDGRRERAAEMAYAELDPLFRQWLSQLSRSTDPNEALHSYYVSVRQCLMRVGDRLVAEAGPRALVGRLVAGPGKDAEPRRISSALAHAWFLSALRKALPLDDTEKSGATT